MAYVETDLAIALPLPRYEVRFAERMKGEGDLERLLSVEASLRNRALVALLYFGGLRISEPATYAWRNLQAQEFDADRVNDVFRTPCVVFLYSTHLRRATQENRKRIRENRCQR
jgi:site-specific recombinase XerD